jgi:hypothetical protein
MKSRNNIEISISLHADQLTCPGVAEAFEMRLVPAAEAVRALP